MSSFDTPAAAGIASSRLYRAVWRWHFFAGLFVAPFLVMLALTGLVMMVYADVRSELGWDPDVRVAAATVPVSQQARAALAAVPGAKLQTYIAPRASTRPAFFELGMGTATWIAAVDPYTGQVLSTHDASQTVRAIAEKIHGSLLLGDFGDRLIETAASLGFILVVTGLYLWWPRGSESLLRILLPDVRAKGRTFWREIHRSIGFWTSGVLLAFLLTGLAWTGVWGDQYVKPWSTFPASKWDQVPTSDLTHASLNHDLLHEVPWALELTPLPASGSQQGLPAVPPPVTLDRVAAWAGGAGFKGQFKLSLPADEKGVFTVAYDARNQDSTLPSGDRYVHVDRYTGKVLADVGLAQYPAAGKLMAWGISLHKGMAGRVNYVFNLVYLALTLLLAVSGVVMWWKRRPAGALGAPRHVPGFRLTAGVAVIALVLGLLFPLGGAAIVLFMLLDALTMRRTAGPRAQSA